MIFHKIPYKKFVNNKKMLTFAIPLENKVLLSHFREAFSLLLRWGIREIIERLKEVQEASTETKKRSRASISKG